MSARILVVDDNPLNVKLLVARLGREYYTVSTASNGPEALEKIRAELPDLVLLDVMMPDMSGFDVCIEIRKDHKIRHIPVILVTALDQLHDRVQGLEAGADDFISKPINELVLLARVRSTLRLKMLMDEWRLRQQTSAQMGLSLSNDQDADLSKGQRPRVLLFSDDVHESEHIKTSLQNLPADVDVATVAMEVMKMTEANAYDMFIVNLNLHEGDGLPLCPALRSNEKTRHTPIVLLANSDNIEEVTKGFDLGANDCILRPVEASELLARTRTQIRHKRSYDRLKANYSASLSMALTDALTGAFNRHYLDLHLPLLLERCRGKQHSLSVLIVDADHFKKVNDTHGHDAGDEVLREIVRRVMAGVRTNDFVARMGGEEFLVALPEAYLDTAQQIAERLCKRIADQPVDVNGRNIPITVSIGVAEIRTDTPENAADGIARADKALYAAKSGGRNRVIVADAYVMKSEATS